MTNAALYLRVSTRDQTTANQEPELRAWADRLGLEMGTVYQDTVSGAQQSRPGLDALLRDAHLARFRVLLVWSLDRLTRAGLGHLHQVLDTLTAARVEVRSLQEPWLSVPAEIRPLLVSIFGWVAEFERRRIGERVRAGQLRAKAAGVKFGRPLRGYERPVPGRSIKYPVNTEEIHRRRIAGESWRSISRALKVPVRTVRRYAVPKVHLVSGPENTANSEPESAAG